MNAEIILSNFARRPVRSSVSVLAVAIEVSLILMVVGLVTGINTETGERTQGVGADIMLQPPGSTVFLGLNQNAMPIEIGDGLRALDGVEVVTPVVTQFNSQGGFDVVYGIEPASFDAITGGFRYIEGRIFERPGEIVVDDLYAEAKGIGVGDEIGLLNHRFLVSGIVEHGKGARLFMMIEEAQEMAGDQGQASLFYIKTSTEGDTAALVEELKERLPGYGVTPMAELVSLMMNSSIPALDAFLTAVLSIAVSIGALVIFLSMYTTISERTREIGILRSLGASKGFVMGMVLREAVVLCSIGIVVGVGLSFVIAELVQSQFPTLMILILPRWVLNALLLALGSGLLGSLYPSLRAASQDPVEALAYE